MADAIFLLNGDDQLRELSFAHYDSEDRLQEWLASYPDLLGGREINPQDPRRWLLVRREMPVPGEENGSDRWSLDHLFVDQDGVPTFVEVKRSTDTRLRREVVGQMLDYAANASAYWSLETIQSAFAERCTSEGRDADEVVSEFIGSDEPGTFWGLVGRNLQEGRLRLLFVADDIPRELRSIVEFLNAQMERTEVLAVEIRQFTDGSLRTLVPRVIGQTERAQAVKTTSTRSFRSWDRESFLQDIHSRHGPGALQTMERVMTWADQRMRPTWGRGAKDGSFTPVFDYEGASIWPFAFYTYGRIEVQFQYMRDKPGFVEEASRLRLLQKLNEIDDVVLPEDSLARRPSFPLTALSKSESLDAFLRIFEQTLDSFRSAVDREQGISPQNGTG